MIFKLFIKPISFIIQLLCQSSSRSEISYTSSGSSTGSPSKLLLKPIGVAAFICILSTIIAPRKSGLNNWWLCSEQKYTNARIRKMWGRIKLLSCPIIDPRLTSGSTIFAQNSPVISWRGTSYDTKIGSGSGVLFFRHFQPQDSVVFQPQQQNKPRKVTKIKIRFNEWLNHKFTTSPRKNLLVYP